MTNKYQEALDDFILDAGMGSHYNTVIEALQAGAEGRILPKPLGRYSIIDMDELFKQGTTTYKIGETK